MGCISNPAMWGLHWWILRIHWWHHGTLSLFPKKEFHEIPRISSLWHAKETQTVSFRLCHEKESSGLGNEGCGSHSVGHFRVHTWLSMVACVKLLTLFPKKEFHEISRIPSLWHAKETQTESFRLCQEKESSGLGNEGCRSHSVGHFRVHMWLSMVACVKLLTLFPKKEFHDISRISSLWHV